MYTLDWIALHCHVLVCIVHAWGATMHLNFAHCSRHRAMHWTVFTALNCVAFAHCSPLALLVRGGILRTSGTSGQQSHVLTSAPTVSLKCKYVETNAKKHTNAKKPVFQNLTYVPQTKQIKLLMTCQGTSFILIWTVFSVKIPLLLHQLLMGNLWDCGLFSTVCVMFCPVSNQCLWVDDHWTLGGFLTSLLLLMLSTLTFLSLSLCSTKSSLSIHMGSFCPVSNQCSEAMSGHWQDSSFHCSCSWWLSTLIFLSLSQFHPIFSAYPPVLSSIHTLDWRKKICHEMGGSTLPPLHQPPFPPLHWRHVCRDTR